jgi:hypothetical protein
MKPDWMSLYEDAPAKRPHSRAASVIAAALVAWLVLATFALVFLAGRASAQALCTSWSNPIPGSSTVYAPDAYASFVLILADGSTLEAGPVVLGQRIDAPQPIVGATKCTSAPAPTPTPTPTAPPVEPTPTPADPGCCSIVVTPTPAPEPTPDPTPTVAPTPTPDDDIVISTPTPHPTDPPCDDPTTCLPPTGSDPRLIAAGFGAIALGSVLLGWALLRDRLTIAAYLRGGR